MIKRILFKELPGRIVWALTCMATALLFACVASPVNAGELVVKQGEVDLLQFIMMLWANRNDLPWYQLAILSSFLLVIPASLFTSLTPTPKPGTLWSYVYRYIEATALTFYKSKDKPIDTESRKYDGNPVDLINDSMSKLTLVTSGLEQAVKEPALKRAAKWLKDLF